MGLLFARRQKLFRADFPQVDLAVLTTPEDRQKVLVELRKYVESFAVEQSAWYKDNRVARGIASLWIRFTSLLLLLLGGICPLLPKDIPAASPLINSFVRSAEPWGYALIGLGGGLLLFDRLFGISSSWMRFINAHLELEELLSEFKVSWLKTQLGAVDARSPETFQALFNIADDAIKGIHMIVWQETNAWRAEFKNNITHQTGLGKNQSESQVPAETPGKRASLGLVRNS